MHLQDVLSSADIRRSHSHLPVESSGTQDGGVQNIHPVGGRHDDNALVDPETVHLHQQLVQCLFTLVVAAAHTGAPASCHSINLVYKYDTG